MICLLIIELTMCLPFIMTEHLFLNPEEEHLYSIVKGDTVTLLCPLNNLKKELKWSYIRQGNVSDILSIAVELNHKEDNYRFKVSYMNDKKQVIYLRIFNITIEEQAIYTCLYTLQTKKIQQYNYTIHLTKVSNAKIKHQMQKMCCEVQGENLKAAHFIWEQRTLFDEHIRFVKREMINSSRMSELVKTVDQHISKQLMSCLNIDKNGVLDYKREGNYICSAQLMIDRRNQTINSTDSEELEHIQAGPLCNQHNYGQYIIPGANTSIGITFYSKPEYLTLSYRKDDSELQLKDNFTVSRKNISLEVYNVTVMVSGYEIIINITEFSDEDIGNYTVYIGNEFGYSNCTVQLLSQGNDFPENNHTEKVVIENKSRAEITKSLQWYILACGSIIVVLFAMSALRSIFLKTVNNCSKPTIRKPCCHKSTEKQATKKPAAKKPRRAYSDQFMEITLNQLNNGERVLIIGQTNEMEASTETNI